LKFLKDLISRIPFANEFVSESYFEKTIRFFCRGTTNRVPYIHFLQKEDEIVDDALLCLGLDKASYGTIFNKNNVDDDHEATGRMFL